jgi:membrane protease YdiL (CAAX protease family)
MSQAATPPPTSDDRAAAALRGFGLSGLLAMAVVLAGNLVSPAISALLALGWARWSLTPWPELGFTRPKSWTKSIVIAFVLGAAFKLLMKAVVMPLFGAPAANPAYHHLVGNSAALAEIVTAVIVGAGFGEETVYRGYLFERLGKALGRSMTARVATVLLTSALFALAHHHDQGAAGVEQAAITGLIFGSVFAVRRQIWTVMIAHAAFDLTAVALIYWNVEADVAHLIFGSSRLR